VRNDAFFDSDVIEIVMSEAMAAEETPQFLFDILFPSSSYQLFKVYNN